MATYYVDYELGNDANAGTAFGAGTAWKTLTLGATAARIAPGDIIKIAKSPAPSAVTGTTATWNNLSKTVTLASANTLNVDMCETAWTASTGMINVLNATPTAGGTGYTNGDVLTITTGGTKATVTATVSAGVVTSVAIKARGTGYTTGAGKATSGGTGSGCTVNITSVASGSVTRTGVATDGKEGSYSMLINNPWASGVGTKLGYYATGTLNLSSYQKLSFWFKTSMACATGNLRIVLCSDTAGETVVDEFLIPGNSVTAKWMPLNIARTGGGNLGASIASIALYTDTVATGSGNVTVDDFIATTTSGLNLQSLISKNSAEQGGAEGWYPIQSINGSVVRIDNGPNTKGNAGKGYYGTTGSANTYFRETIKTATVSSTTTQVQAVTDSGTITSYIEFQGGYDTGTGNQTGETFFDGQCGNGYGIYAGTKNYFKLNRINAVRYYEAVRFDTCVCPIIDNIQTLAGNDYIALSIVSNNTVVNNLGNAINSAYGVWLQQANTLIKVLGNASNHTQSGVTFSIGNNTILSAGVMANSSSYGIDVGNTSNNRIYNLTTASNSTAGIGTTSGNSYFYNCTINESTEVAGFTSYGAGKVYSTKHDGTAYSRTFSDGVTVNSLATTRSGGTGSMWTVTTSSANRSSGYPFDLSLAKIAVTANNLVTVKCWVLKGHATNVVGKLICRGGQLAGVSSDVVTTKANDTSWEELTITFTPTEAGVIEIVGSTEYSAGNSTVTFEDMTITQA